MRHLLTKYFTILILVIGLQLICTNNVSYAEVCIEDQDAVDLITLLDASERDISVLGSCETLVNDLYKQLDSRDKKLLTITNDLIEAKQETLKYKHSSEKWRRVAIYSSITGAVIILIQALPVL